MKKNPQKKEACLMAKIVEFRIGSIIGISFSQAGEEPND
jgi:hypothetical protein